MTDIMDIMNTMVVMDNHHIMDINMDSYQIELAFVQVEVALD